MSILETLSMISMIGGAGSSILGAATEDEPKMQQASKMTPQQKQAFNVVMQQAMSRLGRWIKTPRGQVFEWDPETPEEYPGPRVAPLTQMQQQNIQQASDLTNYQGQIMKQGGSDYMKALSDYEPGNIGKTAESLSGRRPQMESTPYEFSEQALTGKLLPRPDTAKKEPQYFHKNWRQPGGFIDPYAARARPGLWKGPMSQDQTTQAMQETAQWDPKYGQVPQTGYLEPEVKDKSSSLLGGLTGGGLGFLAGGPVGAIIGAGVGAGNGMKYGTEQDPSTQNKYSPYYPSYAQGGFMPNQPSQVNMVGEQGPEMHVTAGGQRNMVGEQGPELFDPNQAGQIISNHALPPQMQGGQGPQQNTGQEMPMPGQGQPQAGGGPPQGDGSQNALNMLANAMMQPAMSMAGAGRAEGGPVGGESRWFYPDANTNTGYEMQNIQSRSEYRDWKNDPTNADAYGAFSQYTGNKPSWNTYKSNWGGNFEPTERTDWGASNQPWEYNEGNWNVAGSGDQWTPGSTWNAGADQYQGGWDYDNATGQYMTPGYTNSINTKAPFDNWKWTTPDEGYSGQAQYAPAGYDTSNMFTQNAVTPDPTDWSQANWNWQTGAGGLYEGNNPYTDADETGFWASDPNQTEGTGADGMYWDAASGRYLMNPYYGSTGPTGWQNTPVGEGQAGERMWHPQGFNYPGTPPTPDVGDGTTDFEPRFPGDVPPVDDGTITPLPDVPGVDNTDLPSMTGDQWFAKQYPDIWNQLQQSISNPQSTYNFDPNAINAEYRESILNPGMEQWQEDTAPWLKEQFVRSGNVLGSEMPTYLAKEARRVYQGYEAERFKMMQEGRTLEASALEAMENRRLSAMNTATGIMGLPSQVGLTNAQTTSILTKLGPEVKDILAGVDLTYASIDSIYDNIMAHGTYSDEYAVDVMIKLAKLPGMEQSVIGQEIANVSSMLDNLIKANYLDSSYQNKLAEIIGMSYADWVTVMGQTNVDNSADYILSMAGYSTVENFYG